MHYIFSLGRKLRNEEPMVLHKGGGGGGTTTVQKADPWEPAQGQLKDIMKQAKQLYDKNGGLDAQAVLREIPGLTPDMASSLEALAKSGQLQEVSDNIQKYTGDAGQLLDKSQQVASEFMNKDFSITGGQINQLSSELYDSETVRNQKQQLAQDLNEQYNDQVTQLNQQANMVGGMGNSRAGVSQAVMAGKAQQAQAKGEADIMNTARGQAQQAALATLQGNQQANINKYTTGMQFYGNLGTTLASQYQQGESIRGQLGQQMLQNQFQAGQVSQQMQNAQQETNYQNLVDQKNAGQQNLEAYRNTVSQIAGQGTSGSTTQTAAGGGASKAQGALGGAMSGAAAGAMIGGPWGAVAGGVIGGVSGLFSDATLKKNIKLKGKTKSGDEVYDWEWNQKGKQKGLKGKSTGVLAQRSGEAISGKKQGALMVDYDKTSVKPKIKK